MRAIDGDRIVKILNECIDKILAIQNLDITYNPKLSAELQVYKDMLEDINEMPTIKPEPHWIPCSERLPEDEYVLISKKPTKISGDKWCVAIAIRTEDPRSRKIQWRDSGFGVIQDDKVLAWMPLPEFYRKEE